MRWVISVALVYRRTVSRNVSMSIRWPSLFFSSSRSALIRLAFSPCSCSYRWDIFANRASLIFWLTLVVGLAVPLVGQPFAASIVYHTSAYKSL